MRQIEPMSNPLERPVQGTPVQRQIVTPPDAPTPALALREALPSPTRRKIKKLRVTTKRR